MTAQDGFIHGDHAQAAVEAAHQVIVAHGLTTQASEAAQLKPMLASLKRTTGRPTRARSADAGYCSEQTLRIWARRHVRGDVATGRHQHGEASATGRRKPVPRTRGHARKIRLNRAGYRRRYRLRTQVVEPVVGQINPARGFRPCLLRGLPQVAGEWRVLGRVHTMRKRAGARG